MVYYILYEGQVTGPMTEEQIFAYSVNRDTMVSANGGDWRPLYSFPELMSRLQNNPTVAPGSATPNSGYQRMVTFGESIKTCFQKYANFNGRASRSEYWWWQLFAYLVSWAASYMGLAIFGGNIEQFVMTENFTYFPWAMYSFSGLVSIAMFLPNLSVAVRRLHDTGHSGWWVLLNFVFCIGWVILLVWYVQPSQKEENKYGPVPYVE